MSRADATDEKVRGAITLTERNGAKGWSYATNATIANLAGVDVATVKRSVARMLEARMVEKQYDVFTGERTLKVRETPAGT